jgi:hypothetical protein
LSSSIIICAKGGGTTPAEGGVDSNEGEGINSQMEGEGLGKSAVLEQGMVVGRLLLGCCFLMSQWLYKQ